MILPHSTSGGVRRGSGGGDVRAFPHVRRSHNAGSPSSPLVVAGYE